MHCVGRDMITFARGIKKGLPKDPFFFLPVELGRLFVTKVTQSVESRQQEIMKIMSRKKMPYPQARQVKQGGRLSGDVGATEHALSWHQMVKNVF